MLPEAMEEIARLVVVAADVVARSAVKFWRLVEAVARKLAAVTRLENTGVPRKVPERVPPLVALKEEPMVVEPVMASVPAADTLPTLLTVKSVVVAKVLEEDAMEKSVVGEVPVVEDATNRESSDVGELVPMPTLPLERKVVDAVPPNCARVEERKVEDALPKVARPVAVSVLNVAPFVALKVPPMVVDAVTAKVPVEVAPVVVKPAAVMVPLKVGDAESAMLPVPVTALERVTPP
jgi:hypothetical protein